MSNPASNFYSLLPKLFNIFSVFRRVEHPVPWHPSAFFLFLTKHFGIFSPDISDVCKKTQLGVCNLSCPIFSAAEFFRRVKSKKMRISNFLVGRGNIFESCFYIKLWNADVFEVNDEKTFNKKLGDDISCQKYIRPIFGEKEKTEKLWIFGFSRTSQVNCLASFEC